MTYHGIPLDYHLFIFVFAILAWAGRLLFKGFQQISRQVRGGSPGTAAPSPIQQAMADARQQAAAQVQPPVQALRPGPMLGQSAAPQTLPGRAAPLMRVRGETTLTPRRPDAGGPAVTREATDEDLRRQERELFASEPSGLETPLVSAAPGPGPVRQALFGSTDDLVRAVILQEVLGPPLSRRSSSSPHTPR